MKVLMLGWELPPHNSGGLGVACLQLCKALAKKSVDIEFILPYTADHGIDFMKVTGAHPFDVTTVMKGGMAYDSYRYIMRDGREKATSLFDVVHDYEHAIGRIVEQTSFDIIHAHDWLTFRAGLRAKMMTGKQLVVHLHSIEADRSATANGGNPLVREIEAMAVMMADRVVAVSEWTRQAIIREYGIPADKVEVIHNSIDHETVEPLDDDTAYKYLAKLKENGYCVLANVGRLTMQKGLPNLLYALKSVVDREPKTVLLIVGSGEQYTELLVMAADLGISRNVVFAGFQRGKKWRDSYGIADLFLLPSVSEPFGLTALEAIGYGTPVLTTYQSGVSEVVKNMLKVDFWDVNEMANQITAAVQNRGLREELLFQSQAEYQRLSWGHSADKLVGIYSRHLNGAHSAHSGVAA